MEFYVLYNYIYLSRIIYLSLWIDYSGDKFYGVNDMDVDNYLYWRKIFILIRSINLVGFYFCILVCFIFYILV